LIAGGVIGRIIGMIRVQEDDELEVATVPGGYSDS
jgi:hypothetical protein